MQNYVYVVYVHDKSTPDGVNTAIFTTMDGLTANAWVDRFNHIMETYPPREDGRGVLQNWREDWASAYAVKLPLR